MCTTYIGSRYTRQEVATILGKAPEKDRKKWKEIGDTSTNHINPS